MKYRTGIPRAITHEVAQQIWHESEGGEAFLSKLREAGASKIESIQVLRQVAGMSLDRSKEFVHLSPTWADRRDNDDSFHNGVGEGVNDLGRTKRPTTERLAS